MSYEELLDFSDSIWVSVESGEISPSDAQDMLAEEIGWHIADWLSANGEISSDLDLDAVK